MAIPNAITILRGRLLSALRKNLCNAHAHGRCAWHDRELSRFDAKASGIEVGDLAERLMRICAMPSRQTVSSPHAPVFGNDCSQPKAETQEGNTGSSFRRMFPEFGNPQRSAKLEEGEADQRKQRKRRTLRNNGRDRYGWWLEPSCIHVRKAALPSTRYMWGTPSSGRA